MSWDSLAKAHVPSALVGGAEAEAEPDTSVEGEGETVVNDSTNITSCGIADADRATSTIGTLAVPVDHHSVLIKRLSGGTSSEELRLQLEALYPGKVLDVQCVLGLGKLLMSERELHDTVRCAWDELCSPGGQGPQCGRDISISLARRRVLLLQRRVRQQRESPVKNTGDAFVTFSTIGKHCRTSLMLMVVMD